MSRGFGWLASVVAASLVAGGAAASGAATGRPALLVVAFSPTSGQAVGHTYDTAGHLIDTVTAHSGTDISWSPDGSQVALADSGGVWVERADGSGERQLLKTKTTCTAVCVDTTAVWSPDGKTLAVGGVDPITTGFVRIEVSSGRVSRIRVARRGTRYRPIAFSPNGKLLAYAADKNNADEALFVCEPNGSKSRLLHQFYEFHDGAGVATWSPDSTRIAFTDDGRDSRDPRFGIVEVATTQLHAIAPHQIYDQSPAWSPAGTRLAVGQFKGPVFTIGADGTGFRPLGITGTAAVWLRSGDLVVALDANGHRFATLKDARGPARTLLTLPQREQVFSIRAAT